jgi:hypothetical protein
MEDPPERDPLLEAVEAAARDLEGTERAISEALAGVDLSAVIERLQAQRLAVKRALPSCEDFWVDLWAFSITPLPWGLGLTQEQLWALSSREWSALYRVWRYHDSNRATNPAQLRPEKTIPARPPVQPAAMENDETKRRRREIIKQYRSINNLTMAELSRRVAMSVTAIEGMVRGDRTRYSEETLSRFLKKIGVSPERW